MSVDCGLYILNGRMPIHCLDTLTWAHWLEKNNLKRHVALETMHGSKISTVFLGIDHNFHYSGRPILFETMVFGGLLDQEMNRCSTWDEAEAMHKRMVARVRELHKWDFTILLFVMLQILIIGSFFAHV